MNAQGPMTGARFTIRHSSLVILWSLVIGHWSFAQSNLPPATVSFLDGSFLRGEIETLNGEALTWRHPNARRPIEFSTTNLNLIRLPPRSADLPTNAGPVCRVVLASGDEFEGQLLSLDADSFEIETWFAGKLRGQRAGLASLAFYGSSQSALYDGPRAAEEWKISTGAATVNRAGVDLFGGRNIVFGGGIAVPQVVIQPAPVAQPIPAPVIRPANPAPAVARRTFTVEELARLSDDAERSATVAVFLKTDLVKEALTAGQTSAVALERWFADFKDPNDWAKDEAKAARFKVMLRAEVDVLVRRLQGRAAPFVEAAPAPAPLPLPVPAQLEARPVRVAPVVPLNQVPPPPTPAPKGKPAPFDITRMSSTARFAPTAADYLKSDLVQLAVESGLVKADAVKAELDKQVAAGGEVRNIIRREGALLAARLLRELEHFKNEPSAATLARTQELLAGAGVPAGDRPPGAVGDAAQWQAAAEITQKVSAASQLGTAAALLKSELMQAAVEGGVASQRAEEEWLARQERNLEGFNENLRTSQLKLLLQAEALLLGSRLLTAKAPAVSGATIQSYEQTRERTLALVAQQAEVRAVGNAAADVLAQARERALGALQLNNPNLALAMGAEGALVGRIATMANANAAWQFRDGAYYSTGVGTLGRECQLPTKARIEFDLAWKGQPFFRFSFFTRSTEHYDYSDGWQFYTSSSGYIYSMRRSGMGATSSSGARVPQMLAKNSVRFTFLVNTEAETVVLLADGEKVHEWKSIGSPGPGTGIVFYNYNTSSRVRLSDIRVAPWDGRERDAAEPLGAPGTDPDKLVEVPPADSAVVEFANRDRATGTLHGIRDGKLAFNPAGTKLEIPLSRAALIAFPVNDAPALPKVEGVQVTLHRNERLTLALEKWEAAEIIAVSPVFGKLKLKPESIRALRFNPAAPRGPVDEWSGP